jgi:murein endopeptidase
MLIVLATVQPRAEATGGAPATCQVEELPASSWVGSVAAGRPTRGRLVRGVMLPESGLSYLTWDPATKAVPSVGGRQWGMDHVVSRTLCVVDEHRIMFSSQARVLIGDISRPEGGPFGREYGGLGHSSHQNGLDVDVYYPRRDGAETIVRSRAEIDLVRSQDLIDRFVAAGAVKIFVGRSIRLVGPDDIVQAAKGHQDHFHVRFGPTVQPVIAPVVSDPQVSDG